MHQVTLDTLADEWGEVRLRWQGLRRDHDEQALTTPPREGVWPVSGIAQHLHITLDLYLPLMRGHIEKLRASGRQSAEPAVKPGWFARKFIHFAGPDNQKKLKAPGKFGPTAQAVPIEWVDKMIAQMDELDGLLAEAKGVELNRGKFGSPITGLIRFTLGEGLLLMLRHHQRHTGQAIERTAMAGEPTGAAMAT